MRTSCRSVTRSQRRVDGGYRVGQLFARDIVVTDSVQPLIMLAEQPHQDAN